MLNGGCRILVGSGCLFVHFGLFQQKYRVIRLEHNLERETCLNLLRAIQNVTEQLERLSSSLLIVVVFLEQ